MHEFLTELNHEKDYSFSIFHIFARGCECVERGQQKRSQSGWSIVQCRCACGMRRCHVAGAKADGVSSNAGVPAECEDVMLQAFYWDSYKAKTSTDSKFGRTKWIDLLKDTAAINANFDVVWFPPSAGPTGCGVGYSAKQYSNQESDWGTKTTLSNLINALHKGNTKVLADVVLNHRGNLSNWCNFFTDNFGRHKELCSHPVAKVLYYIVTNKAVTCMASTDT